MAVRTSPPLNRDMLDSAASPTRVLAGLFFLAWSWVSTVLIVGRFLGPALPGAAIGVPDSYLVALLIALVVTGAEFVSGGRWPAVYWFFVLLLDMPFTAIQTHAWAAALAKPYLEGPLSTGADLGLWFFNVVCGIIAAIFGELLLFGRRR